VIRVVVQDPLTSAESSDLVIQIVIICALSYQPVGSFTNQTYFVGDPALEMSVAFMPTPPNCPTNLSYLVTLEDGSALPTPIVFKQESLTINVSSSDYTFPEENFKVKITAIDRLTSQSATRDLQVSI
jgi:hypothetical protein